MNVLSRLKFSSKNTLPMMFQSERAECGHACIAMVASAYNYRTDVNALRKRFPPSPRGSSLWELMEICKQVRLVPRALRLEPETLNKVSCPAILHWNMNHFVVLKKVTSSHVIIHDPASGVMKYTLKELGQFFTGIALELAPANDFNQCDKRDTLTLRGIAGSIQGWGRSLVTLLCFSFVIEICAVLIPLFTQVVLDKILPANNASLLYFLGAAFLVIGVVKVISGTLRDWVVIFVMNTLNMQITSNLMQHLMALPLAFFENRSAGDILSRFYSTDEIQRKVTTDFVQVMIDGVMTLITIVMMTIYSVKLTCVALLFLFFAILLRTLTYGKLKRFAEERVVCEAREHSQVIETLQAMLPLTVFNKAPLRVAQWQAAHADTLNASIAENKIHMFYNAGSQLLFLTENIVLIFLGAILVLHQQISVGMMIAYLAFSSRFSSKVQSVIDKLTDYKMVSVYLSRLSDIVFQEKESDGTNESCCITKENIRGVLAVKNLSFRYDEQSPFLFENLSFSIEAGQSVALVAPSGFGKTTLMKMLMRLLPVTSGEIMLDDKPIQHYGITSYRSFCAAVMQEDQLLSGTLLENICFFDERPDLEKAEYVAKLACIHEDIMAMTMGYQTLVGELGSQLSGGQRQRVLIARALYREPKILFMDEATSHLDEATEKRVNANIKSLSVTCIIIAHRKTTIASASRVIDLTV